MLAKVIRVHKMKADHQWVYHFTWKLICVTQTLSCDILCVFYAPASLFACFSFCLQSPNGSSEVILLESALFNPCQCMHVFAYVCIHINMLYMFEHAQKCVGMWACFSCVCPEHFCAALSCAVGCFRLRSKFNKPGLTYASILYKHCPVVGPAL